MLLQVDGVPKIIDSNFDTMENTNAQGKSSRKLWILIDSIETTTLYDLINQRPLCIRENLMISLKLVHLIKQIHSRNVVHRNISPQNILINYDSSMSPDQIHVGLIDFDFAWIEQPNNDSSNLDQVKDLIVNNFYRVPQFAIQSLNTNTTDKDIEQINSDQRSRTIDTSFICAILFWMITGRDPKCSRHENGQAPHQLNGVEDIIFMKSISEAGECVTKSFMEHLKLVFDRGFANCKQQWPLLELEYQIRFMLELITHGKSSVDSLLASSTRTISSSVSTESFIRFVSLIDKIKNEFVNRYASAESIRWLNDYNWSDDNQTARNYDTLVICQDRLPINFELTRNSDCKKCTLEF
ncbi:unnamed protein product [Didymodactylos carnosus]|uniref:Protein kinase domain-containing protein n=1 Tax=Didymodactylos carnosus TaxID=1234261 RepID=A0A815THQ2_9BILA|nr:unnamed protein product [Didymodactylos carnosus]CAF4369675.1 unnamed protein product [Didymodactylos carnosus]